MQMHGTFFNDASCMHLQGEAPKCSHQQHLLARHKLPLWARSILLVYSCNLCAADSMGLGTERYYRPSMNFLSCMLPTLKRNILQKNRHLGELDSVKHTEWIQRDTRTEVKKGHSASVCVPSPLSSLYHAESTQYV